MQRTRRKWAINKTIFSFMDRSMTNYLFRDLTNFSNNSSNGNSSSNKLVVFLGPATNTSILTPAVKTASGSWWVMIAISLAERALFLQFIVLNIIRLFIRKLLAVLCCWEYEKAAARNYNKQQQRPTVTLNWAMMNRRINQKKRRSNSPQNFVVIEW